MTASPSAYRDPLEPALLAEVSADLLMEHVRTMGAWERESGSPGEARAFDYIEGALKSYGLDVERREIEAYISLPEDGRVHHPGGTIEGLTHSFSPSTGPAGLEGDLVDAGDGTPEDHARVASAGKIALVWSLATPGKAWAAQQAGTLGQIFVNLDHLHNMIVTTIWGTPIPATADRIPRTPCLTIRSADAEQLRGSGRGRCASGCSPGSERAGRPSRTCSASSTGERTASSSSPGTSTPGTTARWTTGRPTRRCSRSPGFSPPGGASCGAACASRSGPAIRTGATPAPRGTPTTPGATSTGAASSISTSTRRGPGGPPTTRSSTRPRRPRTSPRRWCGTSPARPAGPAASSRAGDQSFWGIGLPSAFMSLSGLPKQDTELSRTMERLFGTSGFPWWWHTREDTVDKIDRDVLALDTRVYVAAALRLVNAPLLPLDYARVARTVAATLDELQAAARGRFDLGPAVAAAARLSRRTDALAGALPGLDGPAVDRANRALVRLSRVLVPLLYTTGDRFHHDLALPIPPLAGLEPLRDLATLDPASDAGKFTVAALVRERNRVVHALEEAADVIAELLT